MFEGTALIWKLWNLRHARKRVYEIYELLNRNPSCEKDRDALAFEKYMEVGAIDDAVQQLQNDQLIRLAHLYLLAVPPIDQKRENWEESEFTGKWRLTANAFIELRKNVRAERKARHEMWQGHIVWIGAATGLIGAVTGLTSVIFLHTAK